MPTVVKAANAHTVVSTGWTNASNAFTDNTSAATTLNGSTTKNLSHSGDFGFPAFSTGDIPDGATINAVRVKVRGYLSATGLGVLLGILPRTAGGADGGTETTDTTSTTATTIEAVFTTIPSLADLRNANGVKARCRGAKGNTSSAFTVSAEYVFIEVDYTAAAQTHTSSGSITPSGSLQRKDGKPVSGALGFSGAFPSSFIPGAAPLPALVAVHIHTE